MPHNPHIDLNMIQVDPNDLESFGRVACVFDCPSQTGPFERLFLYGLVVARRPQRILEIGFNKGGTSLVMAMALEDVSMKGIEGHIVSIDPNPNPQIPLSNWKHRLTLLTGRSPEDIPKAVKMLGGVVELCFIDAEHTYEAVLKDAAGVLPHMAKDGYILFHDACWPEIARGILDFCAAHPNVIDCGKMSPHANPQGWGGLHLLRIG
jgi:predicted O-methyltransferase YrrM